MIFLDPLGGWVVEKFSVSSAYFCHVAIETGGNRFPDFPTKFSRTDMSSFLSLNFPFHTRGLVLL